MFNPLLARPKSWWLTRTSSFLPVVLAIVLVWASIAAHLWVEWDQANRSAIENSGNLARGFSENVSRTIEGVDQVLKILRNTHRADPAHFDLATIAPATDVVGGLTVQIAATDKHGIMTGGNLPMAGHVDLSDREHIRVHFNTSADDLFISKPLIGRVSRKWSIQFTRKMLDQTGAFDGVLVVSLDPYFLSRFYESLEIGNGTITLIGLNDGVIRARAPDAANTIGRVASATTLKQLKSAATSGTYHVTNTSDGIERIASYRRLDAYGLAVVVGLSADEVFAAFHRDLRAYLIVGIGLSVMIGLIGALLARERRRLLRSQAQLGGTLENISQGILMIDADGRVPVMNHRTMELLGLPDNMARPDLTFREIFDWQLANNEYPPGLNTAADSEIDLRMVARSGAVISDTYERIRPNGRILEVRTQALPSGGAVRTFTDITRRKQTEQALASARDAAEAASKARTNFLAMVTHEIRTPLNGVIGMAGLILDGNLPAKERRYAETLRDAGDNLLRIINDILDFSKLEANRLSMEHIPFSLEQVVSSVVRLQEVKAAAKGLYLRSHIARDVPRRLMGDPGRLRQILLNLADNGLKFTGDGGVDIRVALVSGTASSVRLQVEVRDTGMGISPADQGKLFEQFAQVDSSTSRRFGGTGLGLAICRRLVQQMNGEIRVCSDIGRGAAFIFEIELECDSTPEVGSPPPAVIGEFPAAPARRLRVLLAEDNATNQMVATYWLESMGHHVDAVSNGSEAVEAVCSVPYDLVLMDVMMPEKDGLAATREIRAMPAPVGQIPIVAVTANAFEQHQDCCREAGMDAFLSKPIIIRQLVALMDAAIAGTIRENA